MQSLASVSALRRPAFLQAPAITSIMPARRAARLVIAVLLLISITAYPSRPVISPSRFLGSAPPQTPHFRALMISMMGTKQGDSLWAEAQKKWAGRLPQLERFPAFVDSSLKPGHQQSAVKRSFANAIATLETNDDPFVIVLEDDSVPFPEFDDLVRRGGAAALAALLHSTPGPLLPTTPSSGPRSSPSSSPAPTSGTSSTAARASSSCAPVNLRSAPCPARERS